MMRNVYLLLRIAALIGALYFMAVRLAQAATFATIQQAYSACIADGLPPNASFSPDHHCEYIPAAPAFHTEWGYNTTPGYYPNSGNYVWTTGCTGGAAWNDTTKACGGAQLTASQCAAYTDVLKIPSPGATPASVCLPNGCTVGYDQGNPAVQGGVGGVICDVVGGNCYLPYTTAGAAAYRLAAPADGRFSATCTQGQTPGQTASDTDGDGVPNTDDSDTRDTDSDGIVDAKDNAPTDPNNSKDTTGNESDNTSTGGGDCVSAPVSKGDGIAAQVAYQTWKTRCAVEALGKAATGDGLKIKGTVATTGGGTTTVVVGGGIGTVNGGVSGGQNCVHTYTVSGGDPVNAQALVEAQRLRCQESANRTADEAGAGDVGDTSNPSTGQLWQSGAAFEANQAGYGWGSAAPALSMHIAGGTYALPYASERADAYATLRALVIAMAGLLCLYILMGD